MIKIHSEIIDICSTLQTLVSEYTREFAEIENWLEIEESERLSICEREIETWKKEAELYKAELKTQKTSLLQMGKNQLAGVKSDESMYALNDLSYSKRKSTGKLVLEDTYEYPYRDNNDPIEQLDYIKERLRELINVYSSKNPPHLIREIMSRKGTKRHQAYAEMEFLINRAEVIVGMLDKSARTVGRLHEEIDSNAELQISGIRQKYSQEANNLDLLYIEKVKNARAKFEQKLKKLLPADDLMELDKKALEQSLSTEMYKPVSHIPEMLYIGNFEYEVSVTQDYDYVVKVLSSMYDVYIKNDTILILPLLLKSETSHLLFINNRDKEGLSVDTVKGFICRYLLNMPVASTNCFFIDGYYSGANFKIYSTINEVDKNIVGSEVATSSQKISKVLDDILKSNENIVQKRLIDYENLYEFNKEAGDVYERYTLLVIDNFPKGFSDDSFDKLERIILKGEQCGVNVIINYNETLVLDEYGDVEKRVNLIKKHMECYFHASGLLFPEEDVPYTLNLGKVPDNWKSLLDVYCKNVASARSKTEPLSRLLIDDGDMFSRNSCKQLVVPFGVGGPGKIQNLVFGKGVSHSGILVGTTGSGKSTLLNSIILSAIAHYGPEELSLYLLDFKEGMEFSLYANNQVPQVKFVSIESQQELGQSILHRLCQEITFRSEAFKKTETKDIETYRQKTGKSMPRILVIIDEFQSLFDINANYKIAEKCADYMKIIIKQGRSFGINVLIATQGIARLHDISLEPGLFAQMTVRIALKCDDEDADFMFKINPKVTQSFGGIKGTGAYVADDSCVPEKFVTAFMPDEERIEFLKSVGDYYSSQGISSETIVYNGSKNVYFSTLLEETNNLEGIIECNEDYKVILGESMGDVEPVFVEFEPKNKNNLLVVMNEQNIARKLFMNFIECLIINKERDSEFRTVSPFIFFCDYKIQKRKEQAEEPLSLFCSSSEDIFYSKNDLGVSEIMKTLYEEYKQRKLSMDKINQPLFLMLFGLQSISKIMDTFDGECDENEDVFALCENDLGNDENKSAGQIFRILLQKGAQRNIFILAWIDSNQSVKKMEFGDSEFFGHKLLGKMSGDDSDALIGMSIGNSITANQLVYSDANSEIQKLKMYQ